MHALDSKKEIHSPELWAVWDAKSYFLDEALSRDGQHYE